MKGYALLLCLSCGMSPKTLIALGYPRSTVYRWSKNYRLARKQIRRELNDIIMVLLKKEKKLNGLG